MQTKTARSLALLLATSLFACGVSDEFDEGDEETATSDDALKELVRFDVITHNIAGGMLNKGQPGALDNVDGEISKSKPDVVMLQEVCTTQADAFKARHPGWTVEYRVTREVHPECGPGPLGQLIASPHGIGSVDETDLGDADPGKKVTLLCGDVPVPGGKGSVRACSTHLRTKGDDPVASEAARKREVDRLVAHLKPRVQAGQAVVFAGDMNSGPQKDVLDPVYRLKRNGNFGGGLFDEADQTDPRRESRKDSGVTCAANACRSGEPTHDNSKMDHIFFSNNRIGGDISGEVGKAGKSDHNLYRGSAVLSFPKANAGGNGGNGNGNGNGGKNNGGNGGKNNGGKGNGGKGKK